MKKYVALIAIALLTACSQAAPDEPAPLDFSQLPPFHINAAQIRVDQNYQPPLARPNVEHEFPTPPAKAISIWAHERLQTIGSGGLLIVNVDDASVRETLPPESSGVSGLFTKDSAKYDAKLSVTFRLYDGVNPLAVAEATVNVNRSRTLKTDATSDEREAFYAKLTNDLMKDFDRQATVQLKQYFSAYLR